MMIPVEQQPHLIRIGMIGLDTSHVTAFAKLLHDTDGEHYIPGARIVAAFPGGSPDFERSVSRLEGYTNELREQYGVKLVDSPEAVAEQCDAILLESVDGRVHLEQFRRIAPFGKPVFIDKPFTTDYAEAVELVRLAERESIPVMSCSALRYAEGLTRVLEDTRTAGSVIGAEFYGPLEIVPTQPGLFWYGIHTVEMLYRSMGRGCVEVRTTTHADHDLVVGQWADGRIGVIRGNRRGNKQFGGIVHRENDSYFVDVYANGKPYYASLLEQIMQLFRSGSSKIDLSETLEIIRFIEAANASRDSGGVKVLL
ncbi:Gfo/Idh/MocA family protein [Paenibacillus sp. FSL H7-0331]|uniref:Gfo/Idh/MocA family protein n=1 Tax=Paenibacillus sp. FSL H7-0331 TaxID=1920421 RepID=UPI0021165B4F|nr:Gfo/Idh/MocA family oxidoreductase [Paenibacillus sp. FSL H7-0331]